jgi:hypothetical protein
MARKDGTATPAVSKKRDITDQVGRHRPSDAAIFLTKSSARIINLRLSAEFLRKELPGLAMSQSSSPPRCATPCVVMAQAKLTRTNRLNWPPVWETMVPKLKPRHSTCEPDNEAGTSSFSFHRCLSLEVPSGAASPLAVPHSRRPQPG